MKAVLTFHRRNTSRLHVSQTNLSPVVSPADWSCPGLGWSCRPPATEPVRRRGRFRSRSNAAARAPTRRTWLSRYEGDAPQTHCSDIIVTKSMSSVFVLSCLSRWRKDPPGPAEISLTAQQLWSSLIQVWLHWFNSNISINTTANIPLMIEG